MSAIMPVDLRSDTVTAPDEAMRARMAGAAVGDDVFGEDPTVKQLEVRGAQLTGKAAAVYVPSGCMANLIGVMTQAPAGSEIIVTAQSHIHCAEAGSYARVGQVNKWPLETDRFGRYDVAQVRAAIHVGYGRPGGNSHLPTTSVLCFENTHNYCGGTVLTPEEMRAVIDAAREKAPWLKVHLDGARLFNAAAALGRPIHEFAAVADMVSFCLSKGLGAPIGSLLCGSKEAITEAVALRKMLGGGMRQVGILAAAGLAALEEDSISKLKDDHTHARQLAEGLAALPGVTIDLETVQTNILYFTYAGSKGDTAWLYGALNETGVRCLQLGERIRFVTHRQVSTEQVAAALDVAKKLVG